MVGIITSTDLIGHKKKIGNRSIISSIGDRTKSNMV